MEIIDLTFDDKVDKKLSNQSKLEYKFITLWESLYPNIKLEPQYLFARPRRYAVDFAHTKTGILIDIQGGVWMKGKSKHSSGVGITRDCEKLFLASSLGYTMFHLTANMIDLPHLRTIAEVITLRKYSRDNLYGLVR